MKTIIIMDENLSPRLKQKYSEEENISFYMSVDDLNVYLTII